MSTVATAPTSPSAVHEKFSRGPGFVGTLTFIGVLVVGIAYIGWSLSRDLVNLHVTSVLPYFLLGLALFVALGFEFVNGFHDTASAVATVIYTHTLDPHIAVVWSGFFNFLGVVSSTGIVAFGIISLLPVELILQVGSNAGFAMVFALLVAAILWNLGTWYFGLPASSSHTLIGSIIGVGITNQLMSVRSGTSGVDWGQAANVGKSLLISPIVGSRPGVQFACCLLGRNPPCSLAEVTMNSVRTTFLCLLALPFCASCFAQSSGPDTRQITDPKSLTSESNPAARPLPIDDLYFTRSVSSASWSRNGKEIVFTTDISGRSNLWKVNASGGWPIQLAQSDERQYAETWSPDGKWIVFQQDTAGNELWDLFAISSDGGETINLTNTPDIREEGPRWSPDGQTIALNYKPKEATVYDIALLDWATRRVTLLTHESTPNHLWSSVAWSSDGKTLYANRVEVSFTDADVYAIDIASGKTANLTSHQGQSLNLASSLSKDGKNLLITSNQKAGYQNVALLNIASKNLNWITDTKWEAGAGDFSPDGKHFIYTINADGRTDVFLGDLASTKSEKLSIPTGVNGPAANPNSFSPSGDRLLFSHESSVQPGDLWVYDLTSRNSSQLTFSAIASLSSAPRAPSHIVSYKSFDGKTISALLWIPFNLKRDQSSPALVLPHGGPTGQSADYWSPRVAAFVSRGYVCIEPNVRGSTGYGIDFQKANYKDLGGGDLQDEVFAAKFLEATGYVNPKKIGITGGSYGGFMTLMAIGKTPDVWAASAELFGIIDWMTMLKHSDPMLQQYEQSLLGDPVKDRSVYDAASPITYIHNVQAPLLVLQGGNDPRVPQEEAEQVVELLKKDGKTVDAHYYPNEGHGFEKRENQIDSIRRTVAWFDKYLKGKN